MVGLVATGTHPGQATYDHYHWPQANDTLMDGGFAITAAVTEEASFPIVRSDLGLPGLVDAPFFEVYAGAGVHAIQLLGSSDIPFQFAVHGLAGLRIAWLYGGFGFYYNLVPTRFTVDGYELKTPYFNAFLVSVGVRPAF